MPSAISSSKAFSSSLDLSSWLLYFSTMRIYGDLKILSLGPLSFGYALCSFALVKFHTPWLYRPCSKTQKLPMLLVDLFWYFLLHSSCSWLHLELMVKQLIPSTPCLPCFGCLSCQLAAYWLNFQLQLL